MMNNGNGRAFVWNARPVFLFLVLLILLLLVGIHFFHTPRIQVSLPNEGRILYEARVSPGDRFIYSFVHSVEHQLVSEVFEIGSDYRIYLVEAASGGLGAGLPYGAEGRVLVDNGLIRVTELNRLVPGLVLKASPFTSCSLRFSDADLNLSEAGLAGKEIEIKVLKPGFGLRQYSPDNRPSVPRNRGYLLDPARGFRDLHCSLHSFGSFLSVTGAGKMFIDLARYIYYSVDEKGGI